MKAFEDSADSILLLAYGDFSFLGGIYTLLLYCFIYWCYTVISFAYNKLQKNSLISFYLILALFNITWNIEGKLDDLFADMVGIVLVGVLLFAVQKLNLIKLHRLY
jgi:hypothetical protein